MRAYHEEPNATERSLAQNLAESIVAENMAKLSKNEARIKEATERVDNALSLVGYTRNQHAVLNLHAV